MARLRHDPARGGAERQPRRPRQAHRPATARTRATRKRSRSHVCRRTLLSRAEHARRARRGDPAATRSSCASSSSRPVQGEPFEEAAGVGRRACSRRASTRSKPADRMLLRYAAVVGPMFELEFLWRDPSDEIPDAGDPGALGMAPRVRRLQCRATATFAFRHDLVRATAYEGLSSARRRDIHGRVALRTRGARGRARRGDGRALLAPPSRRGEHEKGVERAVGRGARAGDFRNVVAAELYERAIAAAEHVPWSSPYAEIARVPRGSWATCANASARTSARSASYETARDLAATTSRSLDARLLGKESALQRARRVATPSAGDVRAWARAARRRRGRGGGTRRRARPSIELGAGGIHYRQTNSAEAIRLARGPRPSMPNRRASSARWRTPITSSMRRTPTSAARTASRYLELAFRSTRSSGDFRGLGVVLSNLGIDAYYEGRWD